MTFSIASQKPIDAMLMEYIGYLLQSQLATVSKLIMPCRISAASMGGYDIVVPLADKDAGIARKHGRFCSKAWQNTQLRLSVADYATYLMVMKR